MSTGAPEVQTRPRRPALGLPRVSRPRLDVCVLALLLIAGLAAPLLRAGLGLDPPGVRDRAAVNLFGNPVGPGGGHPLGVDGLGRDVLSEMLYGLRSLALLSLAGAVIGIAVAGLAEIVLARLAGRVGGLSWVGWLWSRLRQAVGLFPALLLGLALAGTLGRGIWQILVPVALVTLAQTRAPRGLGDVGPALARALPGALILDVSLTFLGVGPRGGAPQLGAMIARAGRGIVAGVPAWWALVFPGLLVTVGVLAARRLAAASAPWAPAPPGRSALGTPAAPARSAPGTPAAPGGSAPGTPAAPGGSTPGAPAAPARCGVAADPRPALPGGALTRILAGSALTAVLAGLLALITFADLGGAGPGPHGSALARVGPDLGASVSLLLGAIVVWALGSLGQVRRLTRSRRPRSGWARRRGNLLGLPAALVAAAPLAWLAYLTIYAFSDSVGKLPALPGPGSYVGLTHDPGRWAESLLIPWLVLGLAPLAWLDPRLSAAAAAVAASGQQQVARGAGVPERVLARQRRRSVHAALLSAAARALGMLISGAVLVETAFAIPGAGRDTVSALTRGARATVSDVTLLAAYAVLVAGGILTLAATAADPRQVRA